MVHAPACDLYRLASSVIKSHDAPVLSKLVSFRTCSLDSGAERTSPTYSTCSGFHLDHE